MSDSEQRIPWWRQRAEEYRLAAEIAKRPETRETYLKLARNYDALADEALRLAGLRAERIVTPR